MLVVFDRFFFVFCKQKRKRRKKIAKKTGGGTHTKINKYIKWQPRYNNLKKIIESSINWEKKINEKNL